MGGKEILLEAPSHEQFKLLEGLRALWEQGRLCDIALESRDGVTINAHRVVVSAASEPLAALLDGSFAEGSTQTVQLDVTADTLQVALRYLYGGVVSVRLDHIPEVLQFAHLYALTGLEAAIGGTMHEHLDVDTALLILAECDLLNLVELEAECEGYAARHFSRCARSPVFARLPPAWLGRLLRHEGLVVGSEEVVLEALLTWHRAVPGRDESAGLLLQHVRFHLLSLRTLWAVERRAHAMGQFGVHLHREARLGLRRHRAGGVAEDFPCAKRRCFHYWWPDLGAGVQGGVVVAGGHGRGDGPHQLNEPSTVALHRGAIVVADKRNGRVVQWLPGSREGLAIVGYGAPLNGINNIGMSLSIANAPDGGLFVVDRSNDRILKVKDSVVEVLGEGLWELRRPLHACATPQGAVYALDDDGTRVQKLEQGAVTLVAGGCGRGSGAGQFYAGRLCVTASGTLYISDHGSSRVQRWLPGATHGTTVAGGNGDGDGLHQLSKPCGLFITEDETLYIADKRNHRIVKWPKGASSGVVVAGGHGSGSSMHQLSDPVDVVLDAAGTLYVVEITGNRVTRWGPPTELPPDALLGSSYAEPVR